MQKFRNQNLSIEERIDDLLSKLTIDEKIGFIDFRNKGVSRLGIPSYVWWNEALHGLARSGTATVFPQAIAMAATFSDEIVGRMASVIARETRARYFSACAHGDHDTYKGLTLWSPNVNIFRDPRWGRGHETFGECPYLTSRLGVAFVRGVQGNDSNHILAVATPKHFAAHSGPEATRANFNSIVNERDLRETYLYAFEKCIKEGKALSIMSSYNAINGEPASTNHRLLTDILRKEWGFNGAVVTDAGVLDNLVNAHKTQQDLQHALSAELKAGVDVSTSWSNVAAEAFKAGLITEAEIDHALRNQFRIKFKLGIFDEAPHCVPAFTEIACERNRNESLQASRRSIVLLKNRNRLLPLVKKEICTIAVIGPNARDLSVLLGNYSGTPAKPVTLLRGIQDEAGEDVRIFYALGCKHTETKCEGCSTHDDDGFSEAIIAAENADVVIGCFGLNPLMEGEIGDASNADASGDRLSLELPDVQKRLIDRIAAIGKPFVIVNVSGSAVNIPIDKAEAVIQCFYLGEQGGTALADVIFGKFNPCGRLPVTFYHSTEDLPSFDDYSMENRTYRFFKGKPLFPFAYGLSYTSFTYSGIKENLKTENPNISLQVTNTGNIAGEHSIPVFISLPESKTRTPLRQLAGIGRVSLEPGEATTVIIPVAPDFLHATMPDGTPEKNSGVPVISIGTPDLYD